MIRFFIIGPRYLLIISPDFIVLCICISVDFKLADELIEKAFTNT